MKINNLKNRGFLRLSVFAVMVVLVCVLFLASCSGSEENNTAVKTEGTTDVNKDVSDSSREFAGNIVQTTCLECHPAVKDGGFDIDFNKVKTSSVAHSKNMDVPKETDKKSETK